MLHKMYIYSVIIYEASAARAAERLRFVAVKLAYAICMHYTAPYFEFLTLGIFRNLIVDTSFCYVLCAKVLIKVWFGHMQANTKCWLLQHDCQL